MSVAPVEVVGMVVAISPPVPADEHERLAALRDYHVLDTPPEMALDELVQLAAELFHVRSAVINLIDADRAWAKSAIGVPHQGGELAREDVFCAWTILHPEGPTVIPDAALDPRFRDGPLVEAGLRFYAGSPLLTPEGLALGTICVMDELPREPSVEQLDSLRVLAAAVATHLDLHRRTLLAERVAAELRISEAQREAELKGLRLLSRVQGQFARDDDLLTVWSDVCAAAVEICSADGAQLWRAEPDGGLRAQATAGVDLTGELISPGSRSAVRDVMSHSRPVFVKDARERPLAVAKLLERHGAISLHFRPVISDSRTSAVLSLFWREPREELSSSEEHLLELLSGESAIAIERMSLLARLREASHTDPLTGAANRRQLSAELDRAIKASRRQGSPLCLAILDLDHFKRFNDRHGHLAGDELLKNAVAAWQQLVRTGDVLARYGGEEFAVVLPDCDSAHALQLLQRLRHATPHGQHCSAGVALFAGAESATELIRRADRALYQAKKAGRDTVRVADGTHVETAGRHTGHKVPSGTPASPLGSQ
jgi:diguanylate cyclase (GGDEF)-like protein